MALSIFTREDQGSGQFNGGAILESKPIGFPQDGGKLKPYSNLFYWADAWSENGSTIGEHPHQGFEIMSFVVKGEIEHYDSHYREWRKLSEGSAQIIRSGSGITHSEHLHAGSEIFQIWLDPNLQKTLNQPATYTDYPADAFPVEKKGGQTVKTYMGKDAPMEKDAEGVSIREVTLEPGEHDLPVAEGTVLSCFVMDGKPTVVGKPLEQGTFFTVQEQETFNVQVDDSARLFIIESPVRPSYRTYVELIQERMA